MQAWFITALAHMVVKETETASETTSARLNRTHQTNTGSGGVVGVGITTRNTHVDRESEVTVEPKMKSVRTRSVYLFSIHVDAPLT